MSDIEKPKDELEPCPFCGSHEVFILNMRLPNVFSVLKNCEMAILCPECDIEVDYGSINVTPDTITDKQIEACRKYIASRWNTRAEPNR